MKIRNTAILMGALLSSTLAAHSALAQSATPQRIRGDIVSADATTLVVHRRSGETVNIALTPETGIGSLKKMDLSDIKPGSFIGTATRPSGDGHLEAVEVLVFPEAARGTGEGHYAWDLLPGGMMTNANVDAVVQSKTGRDMKLSYKGGSKDVTIPEGTPIVSPQPAAFADLKKGMQVFVVAVPDGDHLKANRVIVEKDGVAPPM